MKNSRDYPIYHGDFGQDVRGAGRLLANLGSYVVAAAGGLFGLLVVLVIAAQILYFGWALLDIIGLR